MLRELKQNLVCTRSQRPHRDGARTVFECLLWRYRSVVACRRAAALSAGDLETLPVT